MNVQERWAEFEKEGEESIRIKRHQGLYGHRASTERIEVERWLLHKIRERAERGAGQQKEWQRTIDREAREQARFSKWIAIAALIVSILALLKGFLFGLLR